MDDIMRQNQTNESIYKCNEFYGKSNGLSNFANDFGGSDRAPRPPSPSCLRQVSKCEKTNGTQY